MTTNLDVVQELYRCFKEKNYAAFKKICDKNIIWNQNPGFPSGSSYAGADQVIDNVFKSFDKNWNNWKFTIDKYHDAGDAVIVTGVYQGEYNKTGKAFISEAAHVYELKNGKVLSFQQYADSKVIWDAMG